MSEVGIPAALAAGLLSFLSPCVLPLVPAYLSMASGYAVADIAAGSVRLRTLARSLAFSAGFTLVFVALGLAFSGVAVLLGGLSRSVSIASGILVIVLGLNLAFDLIRPLSRTAKPGVAGRPAGFLGSLLLGMAFGAGWTPCVGPILASILLAAAQGGMARAAVLLVAYSAGLALPFLAAGLFFDRLRPALNRLKRHGDAVRLVSAALLVALGALMVLGRLGAASAVAASWGRSLEAAIASSGAAVRRVAAAAWALAAAAVALPALARRARAGQGAAAAPGAATAEPARPRPVPVLRFVIAAALAAVAAGEAAGLWSTAGPRSVPVLRFVIAAALAAVAAGEAAGLWSTAGLAAAWLSFQGA
jgi:cytochrome c-type biogenesis protein